MDGPRLDSQLRQVDSLFRLVEDGISFVRIGQNLRDGSMRARALEFAERTHLRIIRLMTDAPLTAEERDRLWTEVNLLHRAIESCRR